MKRLYFSFALLLLGGKNALAALEFDLSALELTDGQKQTLDKEMLKSVDSPVPGHYSTDIYINDNFIANAEVEFVTCGAELCPQLDKKQLSALGLNLRLLPMTDSMQETDTVTLPSADLPGVKAKFVSAQLRLSLTIPQAILTPVVRDDVPISQWDDGLPMMFSSWSLSGQQAKFSRGDNSRDHYLNLRSGANLGGWRLRNYSYYTSGSTTKSDWQSLQSYLSHDIKPLRSQLYLGQYSTPGRVFGAFNFKGAQIQSDSDMQPDSLKGYAPIVRGVALSQAKVEIRQKGNLLYQTFVPPGPFQINDLYPTSASGDLEVSIQEADGSVRTFVQPFASVPMMVRRGQLKYALTAGRYDNQSPDTLNDNFAQFEFLFGLLNSTTVYGGMLGAKDYQQGIVGLSQGLGVLGSVSTDIQHSRVSPDAGRTSQGQAWQAKYNKVFDSTNTTLSLSYLRYLDSKFRTFEQYESANVKADDSGFYQQQDVKDRSQISLSQAMSSYGTLTFSGFRQTGFASGNQNLNYNANYSFSVFRSSVSLGYSRSTVSWGDRSKENVFSFNISVPLDSFYPQRSAGTSQVGYGFSRSDTGRIQHQTSLSGTLLEENNLSYSLAQSYSRNMRGEQWQSSEAADMRYNGSLGNASLGYAQTDGQSKRISYGLSGSVVAHQYGVTLGQEISQLDSAFALVRAPGVSNVAVMNKWGVKTNSRGYAVVPYLQPYRFNNIQLDTTTVGDDAELSTTQIRSVPTKGAMVLANYDTLVGQKAYIQLIHNGKALPFGSEVLGDDGAKGMIDDRGYAWITGLSEQSRLKVSTSSGSCSAYFLLSEFKKINGVNRGTLRCE